LKEVRVNGPKNIGASVITGAARMMGSGSMLGGTKIAPGTPLPVGSQIHILIGIKPIEEITTPNSLNMKSANRMIKASTLLEGRITSETPRGLFTNRIEGPDRPSATLPQEKAAPSAIPRNLSSGNLKTPAPQNLSPLSEAQPDTRCNLLIIIR
jgi:hypothetical protein